MSVLEIVPSYYVVLTSLRNFYFYIAISEILKYSQFCFQILSQILKTVSYCMEGAISLVK